MPGESIRDMIPLNRFGGLVTDIPEQALSGESPDLHNLTISIGNKGVNVRGGLEILRYDIDYADAARPDVHYTVFKESNPTGEGWIVGVQEHPSKKIIRLFFWDNDYPPFSDEAAIVYFAEAQAGTV